jgi:RimJ/RimL family protein N-acetyltransferase
MALTIRKLLPADSPAYRRVRLACLARHPTSFSSSFEEESPKDRLPFEQKIEEEAVGAFIMGALDGAELVGICGFVQANRRKVRHHGDIRQVYVAPAYAGRGVGRALMVQTIRAAFALPEVEQIFLGVVAGNAAANKLYESLGFKECGLQRKYLKVDNQYFDHRLMVLFRSDFQDALA